MQGVVAAPLAIDHIEPLDLVGQLGQHDFDLLLRQSGTDTAMDTTPEAEMVGRVAPYVEPVRVHEPPLIAIGRSEQHRDAGAGRQGCTGQADRSRGDPGEALDWWLDPEHLVGRR